MSNNKKQEVKDLANAAVEKYEKREDSIEECASDMYCALVNVLRVIDEPEDF